MANSTISIKYFGNLDKVGRGSINLKSEHSVFVFFCVFFVFFYLFFIFFINFVTI